MMIYKFRSQAHGEVVMLASNGVQMLTIIGRQASSRGVITVAQMPAAIAALEAAVVTHEAAAARGDDHPGMELAAGGDGVRLRARAAPFIELLRNSAGAGKDVVWGV